MATRLISSRWALLAILLPFMLFGVAWSGMLAAGVGEPDQGQDTMTGSVKALDECRVLVEELTVLAKDYALNSRRPRPLWSRQASLKEQTTGEKERREHIKALMEQLRQCQEITKTVKATDPVFHMARSQVEKIKAELLIEARSRDTQPVHASRPGEPTAVPTELRRRYYASIGGTSPTVIVLVDSFTGQCWAHSVGAKESAWIDLGRPVPSRK